MASRVNQIAGHLASAPGGLLKDQVAIITGAAQGIGRSCAHLFAQEGAKVVVVDLDGERAQKVGKEIEELGGKALVVQADITADDFPKKVIKSTIEAFGDIHHIVNNAGFTADRMLHTMNDQAWELMIKVHNTAPFRLIREAAPYLRTKDPVKQRMNRSITNVSSISGLHGNVGQINYSMAKAGVLGMTKTIAKEWGPFGVRCNTVAFGTVETRLVGDQGSGESITVGGQKFMLGLPSNIDRSAKMRDVPLGRTATPEEAAGAILFLASPLASYVTGHTLEVTGGKGI